MTADPAQRVDAYGRVELTEDVSGAYISAETKSIPIAERTWTQRHFTMLWVSMSQCIPAYLLASGLIALGMNWVQALVTIALANLLVLIPMVLNSHAGTKYGIGFPVFARAFYGLRGAHLAGLLRGLIACGWFGIQTWIGGQAIYVIVGQLAGSGWTNAAKIWDYPWTVWLCFAVFLVLELLVMWRGMHFLRRFEVFAAPLITVTFAALAVWMLIRAGGFGPILSQPSKLGWGKDFWVVFAPSLMGMIAFWATMSLNMPDFTRFAKSQRAQALGQALGLPTAMTWISLISILVTSATIVVYGKAIWDPVELASTFHNPVAVILGLLVALLATMSATIAADVVSPSYVFANAAPRFISFRTGALITSVIGIVIQPWRLIADPNIYIFTWLGFYGGIVTAMVGVTVAGYWVINRTQLHLPDLYSASGRYWYRGGWNWRAVLATLIAALVAVGGAHSAPGKGPFPVDGLIPALKIFYDYSTGVGLVTGFLVYLVLALPVRKPAETPEPLAATE
jgi:NCS1 family nucleobase:cation symporter-1